MGDPRHMAMHTMPGVQQATLQALAQGHYPSSHGSLPAHLLPPGLAGSQAAMQALQYQLAAAASLGISPEAILKGGYPGSGLVSPHPSHDLLLERERQIAQERARNLRERREQEQRERDRLDKERADRERREREERERKEKERKMIEVQRAKDERERQAVEADVNRHFELSIELARKKMGAGSSWGGQMSKEEEYQAREQLGWADEQGGGVP